MNFDEAISAIRDADRTLGNADMLVEKLARVMKGRLRRVPTWVLKDLKRELQEFDSKKGKWKS